jgi:hypothetical protein
MLTAGALLALAPAAAWTQTPKDQLVVVVVENADTPAEHQALARYYRTKADDARLLASEHRAMAQRYHGKPGERLQMQKHCDRIATLNDELATEFESLAKGEDALAKK